MSASIKQAYFMLFNTVHYLKRTASETEQPDNTFNYISVLIMFIYKKEVVGRRPRCMF